MSRSYPDSNSAKPGITALELALRAARSGQKTCLIQLQAGREPYEELVVEDGLLPYLNVFPALGVEIFGEENRASWRTYFAKEALELAGLALACGQYYLVILDEVATAISSGSIKVEDIQELKSSLHSADLVLIGMSEDKNFALTGVDIIGAESLNQKNTALKAITLQGRGYETTSLH